MLAADTQADIGPDLGHLKEPAAVCSSPSVLHNATSTQSILPVVAATNKIIQVLQGRIIWLLQKHLTDYLGSQITCCNVAKLLSLIYSIGDTILILM